MTTLVTGATGFVGSAVARRLLAAGHDVRVLARENSDHRNLDGLSVDIAVGDLTDRASLERAVRGCDALFHVAADYRLWVPRPADMYAANVDGTIHLMGAAASAGVTRIVYTSSVATLGLRADGYPADEDSHATFGQMIGHYKRSKFQAEEKIRRMATDQGLPVVIVNPSTPVGARDVKPTPTGRMIVEAASGRMTAYVDTGLNIVHVDDVAEGHFLAFSRGEIGERYILGGENMTLKQILIKISELTGGPPPRVALPHALVFAVAVLAEGWSRLTRAKDPLVTLDGVRMSRKRMFFSSEKARRTLAYAPRPAAEALADAVDWFRRNGYCGSVS